MTPTLTVVDTFAPDPEKLRADALRQSFENVTFKGHEFAGVAMAPDDLLLGQIGKLTCRPLVVRQSFFRVGTSKMRPTTYIHADVNCGRFAGVLYLNRNDQRFGGTAFWRHKSLDVDILPEPVSASLAARLNEDGQDESLWEMIGLVAMRFNRFICYPTNRFHSRFPNHVDAPDVQSGRLVYCVMFDIQ